MNGRNNLKKRGGGEYTGGAKGWRCSSVGRALDKYAADARDFSARVDFQLRFF